MKYYDASTGTEHLWGFGHFRMKGYPQAEKQPVVMGSQMLGLNLRLGRDDYGVGLGYDLHSRVSMPTDGSLLLQWPNYAGPWPGMHDLFSCRIGTNIPPSWTNRVGLNAP